MIISLNRIKLLALMAAIIIIPFIGINLINICLQRESAPRTSPAIVETNNGAPNSPGISQVAEIAPRGIFSEYRLERERVRSKEVGLLKDIVNNPASPPQALEAAYLKLVDLADREEKELQAEVLIKSQGFQDCAVVITPAATTVLLEGSHQGMAEQEKIKKSVSVATGYAEKSILVVKFENNRK